MNDYVGYCNPKPQKNWVQAAITCGRKPSQLNPETYRVMKGVARSTPKGAFYSQKGSHRLGMALGVQVDQSPDKVSVYLQFTCLQRTYASTVLMLCCAKSLSHVQLFVTPWTVPCQAPMSMALLQARVLEWVVMPSSGGSSQPRDRTQVSHTAGGFFTIWATGEAQ